MFNSTDNTITDTGGELVVSLVQNATRSILHTGPLIMICTLLFINIAFITVSFFFRHKSNNMIMNVVSTLE